MKNFQQKKNFIHIDFHLTHHFKKYLLQVLT
jgi:hypothetical protein